MKFVFAILFFTLVGIALSSRFTEDLLLPTDKECIKELGLETKTVLDAISDDFSTVEGNADINKFTECAFKKVNAIDENNVINFEVMKSIVIELCTAIKEDVADKEKIVDDAMEACKNTQGTDVGDQTVKFLNCFTEFIKTV